MNEKVLLLSILFLGKLSELLPLSSNIIKVDSLFAANVSTWTASARNASSNLWKKIIGNVIDKKINFQYMRTTDATVTLYLILCFIAVLFWSYKLPGSCFHS